MQYLYYETVIVMIINEVRGTVREGACQMPNVK